MYDNSGMTRMIAQIVDIGALKLAAFLYPARLVCDESDDVHLFSP